MDKEIYKNVLGKKIKKFCEYLRFGFIKFVEVCKIDRIIFYRIEVGIYNFSFDVLWSIVEIFNVLMGKFFLI